MHGVAGFSAATAGLGAAAAPLLDGGVQITSYKTKRLSEFGKYFHMFAPYTDAAELYEALPEKWRAINAVRLPSGKTCPAFIADMTPPPKKVKDRSYAWQQSAEKYGRPWKQVRDRIQAKRAHYQGRDAEWLAVMEAAKLANRKKAK